MNRVIVGLFSLILSGCAIHYTDNQGKDSYFGLVSVSTEVNRCVITSTSKSFGLTIDATEETGGVNIGFRSTSKSYISGNELVEIEEGGDGHAYPTNITSNCSGRETDTPLN